MLPHQVIMAGKVAINPKLCSFFHNVETLWWVGGFSAQLSIQVWPWTISLQWDMSRSDGYHVFAGVFKKQRSLIHCLFAFLLVENNTSGVQHSTQEWWSHKMESVRVSESQARGKLPTIQEFLLVLLHEQEGKKIILKHSNAGFIIALP